MIRFADVYRCAACLVAHGLRLLFAVTVEDDERIRGSYFVCPATGARVLVTATP